MKKSFIVSFILFLSIHCSFSQTAGDYRSAGTGDWNQPGTWETFDGLDWIPAIGTPNSTDGIITIQNFHEVTVPNGSSITADQIQVGDPFGGGMSSLIIASGGTLNVVDGPGTDLGIYNDFFDFSTVITNGALTLNQGATIGEFDGFGFNTPSGMTLSFNNGGTYNHNYTSNGTIPYATWNPGSTCAITGFISGSAPTGLDQTFHHFTWNCLSSTGNAILGLTSSSAFNGDFTVLSTNTGAIQLITNASANNTINIGGNFSILNNARVNVNGTGTNNTFNILGNFTIATSGATTLTTSGSGALFNVNGSFNKSGSGSTVLSAGGSGSSTISLKSNFSLLAGTLTSNAGTTSNITFSGTSTQMYVNNGVISNKVNFTIANNAIVDAGTSTFTGTGNFTLNGAGTLKTAHIDGISSTVSSGNIVLSGTRTFTAGATIIYNGSVTQNIGNGFPVDVNLVINNTAGVLLSAPLTINATRTLTLQAGSLSIGSNTLTLNGFTSVTAGDLAANSTSTLVIGGTGALGTIPFSAGTTQLGALTLGRSSGSATLGTNLDITNSLTLTDGNFIINNRTLTLSGTSVFSGTGRLSGNTSTIVVLNGTGSLGSLNFASGGNSIHTLTMDRSGSGAATIASNLTINNNLNLNNGALTTSGILTMNTGSTIIRTSDNGTISSTPTAQSSYNVTYHSALTTGTELPSLSTALNNLTIDPNAGSVIVNSGATVNGSLFLTSGSLNNGSNNITMASGSIIQRTNGSISNAPAGSNYDVIYAASNTTGPEVPSSGTALNNLTINLGATVTANATISLNGNWINNGSYTAGTHTVIFTGSAKSISGTNSNFNNLTLGSSASVSLASSQNLRGTLTLGTTSNFTTTGQTFTLVSDASRTARIAALGTGASITGTITAQRFIPAAPGRYTYHLSSPVSNAPVSNWQAGAPTNGIYITGPFTGASNPGNGITSTSVVMQNFNASTGAYANYPTGSNSEILNPRVGYRVFVRDGGTSQAPTTSAKTISVTGTPNTGTQVFTLGYSATGGVGSNPGGWNFLGNPYPSNITANLNATGWTKSGLAQNAVYIWDADAQTYVSCNGGTGSCTIPSSQGFWVQRSSSGGSLSANENVKIDDATAPIFRMSSSSEKMIITLLNNPTNISNKAYLALDPQSTDNFDGEFDAYKLDNTPGFSISPTAVSVATKSNGLFYSINTIPAIEETDTIPLYIVTRTGNNTLDFSEQTLASVENIYLVDDLIGSVTDIKANPLYNFNASSDTNTQRGRFKLVLTRNSIISSVGDAVEKDVTIHVYPNPSENKSTKLMLRDVYGKNVEVIISDITGKSFITKQYTLANGSLDEDLDLSALSSGIYTVHCKTSKGVYTQKLIVQ